MKNISIYVETGSFPHIDFAANLTTQIDWSNENSNDTKICTACFGAVDLKNHLIKILPPEVSITLTNTFPKDGVVFVVGPDAYTILQEEGINTSEFDAMNDQAVFIKSFTKNGVKGIALCGKTRSAYLHAISEYLFSLGVRWFSPGEKGTHIPSLTNISFENVEILSEPQFITRGCYSELISDDNIEFLDWMMHNKMNFAFMEEFNIPHEVKKRGIGICSGGHVMLHKTLSPNTEYPYSHSFCEDKSKPKDIYAQSSFAIKPTQESPKFTYFKAHPEWYASIGGKRSSNLGKGDVESTGDNFCTSNKDAITELCKNIVESLRNGWLKSTDFLNFWMLDNGKWCECDECKALGNYSYRLLLLVHAIDKAIKQANKDGILNRNVKIMFPVYHETLPMPDKELPKDFDYNNCIAIYFPIERCYVHNLDDKNCTETNAVLMKRLQSWATNENRTYKGDIFLGEYYNVSAFASMSTVHIDMMKKEIPFYYELGARHMYYMHMTNKDWGTLTLLNYQLYQMLWNPSLDVDSLVQEYFELYYKNVSPQMESFYRTLEKITKNMKYFKHYQFSFEGDEDGDGKRLSLAAKLNTGTTDENELFPLKHLQFDTVLDNKNASISMVDMVNLSRKCREMLDAALMQSSDSILTARLEEEDMRFTYSENMIMYIYYMTRMSILRGKNNHILAKNEFKKAEMYAKRLMETTFPTRDLLHFNHYKNGLKATWAENAYYNYKQIYGFGY